MLILTRKQKQSVRIADNIEVLVILVQNGRVRIGIDCPRHMRVFHSEIYSPGEAAPLERVHVKAAR